ncbi:MAG: hypothetical protein U5K31_05315 [Balneolaceae bacterium]|nr:hypothetical protein [Balneolaceae bacterium]
MAAVLSHNMGDIDKVSKFIEECYRNGITVDPPNINTGEGKFVALDGRIQYGMEAIEGVGTSAVEAVVEEREENGPFDSVYDFASRIDSRVCNKRTLESLFQAGAFDSVNPNRRQLLENIETLLSYGSRVQEMKESNQSDLFGDGSGSASAIDEPPLREVEPWSNIERLNKERELIGFYLSGHPLEQVPRGGAPFLLALPRPRQAGAAGRPHRSALRRASPPRRNGLPTSGDDPSHSCRWKT